MMKDALEDLRIMLQLKQGSGKGYFNQKNFLNINFFFLIKSQNLKSDNNPIPFNLSELMEDDEDDDILMEQFYNKKIGK